MSWLMQQLLSAEGPVNFMDDNANNEGDDNANDDNANNDNTNDDNANNDNIFRFFFG